MSITSLSFTFVNTYASQSAAPAAATGRQTAPAAEACDDDRPGGGQNRLAQAILSALRELGVAGAATSTPAAQPAAGSAVAGSTVAGTAAAGSSAGASAQAATPAVTTGAATSTTAAASSTAPATSTTEAAASATATQPATDTAATVDSAVHEFAHELFQALRQVGRSDNSDSGSGHADSVHGGGHHHHHHRREHGYGDLSQRIDALSQTFGASAPAAAASASQPASGASSSLTITLTVQDGQPAAAVETPVSATPASTTTVAATSTPAANAAATPAATTPATSAGTSTHPASAGTATNSLLQAFTNLFNALKPSSTATTGTDMAGKLRTFLQTLAQALRPEAVGGIQAPQVGSLVNVTA